VKVRGATASTPARLAPEYEDVATLAARHKLPVIEAQARIESELRAHFREQA
jgi:uncharacterized protein (DUF111 family)